MLRSMGESFAQRMTGRRWRAFGSRPVDDAHESSLATLYGGRSDQMQEMQEMSSCSSKEIEREQDNGIYSL